MGTSCRNQIWTFNKQDSQPLKFDIDTQNSIKKNVWKEIPFPKLNSLVSMSKISWVYLQHHETPGPPNPSLGSGPGCLTVDSHPPKMLCFHRLSWAVPSEGPTNFNQKRQVSSCGGNCTELSLFCLQLVKRYIDIIYIYIYVHARLNVGNFF